MAKDKKITPSSKPVTEAAAKAEREAAEQKAIFERESLFDAQAAAGAARRLEKLGRKDRAVAALIDENAALRARLAKLEATAKPVELETPAKPAVEDPPAKDAPPAPAVPEAQSDPK
jgi:hypothetical protein